MAQIKGFTVELDGNTLKLQKALKQVNTPISTLQSKLRQVENAMRFDKYNPELIAQKQKYLNQAVEETQIKLKKLKAMQKQAAEAMERGAEGSEDAYDRLTREIVQCEGALRRLNEQAALSSNVGVLGQRFADAGAKLSSLGQKLMPATVSIGLVGAAATNSAVEFDSAFAGVVKTVDATDGQLAKLKNGIRQMSKEIPASTTEISAVAEAAGQLGIETDNILGFTEVMIGLGEATNLSADEAASALAKFANVTGMAQSDFDRLGSTVVALGNNFATTEADIVNMGQRLSSSGTLAGLTEPQILALATAMSSVGIEAEAGGTAMSQTLTQIGKAVSAGGKDLQKFAAVAGTSADDFARKWKSDPISAIEDFVKGLAKIDKSGGNVDKTLADLGMSGIRQSNMLKSLALNSEGLADAVNLANGAWEDNIALTEETSKRYDTLAGRMEKAKNKISDAGITIGEILAPYVEKAADKISNLVEKISELPKGMQKFIVVAGLAVAAAGPLLAVLGFMASGIGDLIKLFIGIPGAISGAMTAFELLTGSVKTLFGLLTTNPIGIIVLAAAGLITALILLYNANEDFRRSVNESINEIRPAIETLKQAFSDLWAAVGPLISTAIEAIGQILIAIMPLVTFATNILAPIITSVVTLITRKIETIAKVATIVVNAFVSTFNRVSEVRGKISSGLNSALSTARGFVSKFTSIGRNIITGIVNGIKSAASSVANALSGVVNNAVNAVKRKLGIRSPSRVFRDQVGIQIPAGIAAGVNKGAGIALKSVGGLADNLTGAAKVATDVEYNAKMGQSNNATAIGSNATATAELLEEFLPKLLAAAKKEIYLDGKTLVGGTIGEINNKLGTIGQRQERGSLV